MERKCKTEFDIVAEESRKKNELYRHCIMDLNSKIGALKKSSNKKTDHCEFEDQVVADLEVSKTNFNFM